MTAVEIKNVKKVYGKGDAATVALKGVNFEANLGEVVLLMGPSGAGKSTLLTIIGALQSATSGTVKIDGQDITQLKEKDRSRLRLNKLGFVLQAYNLVPYLTVQEQFQLLDRVKVRQSQSSRSERIARRPGHQRSSQQVPWRTVRRAKAASSDCPCHVR